MAEEAFVLSPMSARASPPGEADYDAIREAFMETARGRWFLSEYARRNRNADTAMVLDAVSRIEAGLAIQKQTPATGVNDRLGAIRSAIRDAKVTAAEAMPRADGEAGEAGEAQSAARNGARIIREIASMLRKCGADTRICDLLDTQIAAIDKAQHDSATADHRAAVLATFDTLTRRIEDIAAGADGDRSAVQMATAFEQSADAIAEKREASVTPLFKTMPQMAEEAAAAIDLIEAAAQTGVAQADVAQAVFDGEYSSSQDSASQDLASQDLVSQDSASQDSVSQDSVSQDSASQDLAVLDIVAMEMAAEDASAPEGLSEPMPESLPEAVSIAPDAEASAVPRAPDQPSLGAALIASGLVPHPGASAADPLAPIRRMSQAERIALFS